ncbi:MAG: hypothetical protein AAF585_00430 [Verrucomicrobiota bacterium]
MDVTTITTALGGLKTATDIAKTLKNIDGAVESAELKLKIIELLDALVETKSSVVDLRSLLEEKETEIAELRKEMDMKRALIYESPFYLTREEEKSDGPFCQSCYDSEGKLIRLQPRGTTAQEWQCLNCGEHFFPKGNAITISRDLWPK